MRELTPQQQEEILHTAAGNTWKTVGIRDHHGIVVPLFALHSKTSCGIGEFTDLAHLFPWCKSVGFDVIQLLPLNDTGTETSPYSALSAIALNPIHLSLHALPFVQNSEKLLKQLEKLQLLTRSQRISYPAVHKGKLHFLRDYYRHWHKHTTDLSAFREFKTNNHGWCYDYALYKTIKVHQQWRAWETWPTLFKEHDLLYEHKLPPQLAAEVDFHQFLQFLCFQQFELVKSLAELHNIKLKGDIPILINRDSADVWKQRSLFDLNFAAGAPSDMYAAEGQKWGFPLYNWDAMARDGYRWWKERLGVASHLYHIYRIDHIVGFYRIWGVPIDKPAKEGHFIPSEEAQWIPQGDTLMRMLIEASPLLPVGEDLGTVPPAVRESMQRLGICGTKVMRWERYWHGDQSYIPPSQYPLMSMTTVSTHDSETLGQWWSNQQEEARRYAASVGWEYQPELTHAQRLAILQASHQSNSLFHINLLNEYLALFPNMTWPNPADERINIPGTLSDHNWTYRFRPSVEEISTLSFPTK